MATRKPTKIEFNFERACDQARDAFRTGNVPARPVILLGNRGFYFGDEGDETKGALSVCTCLDEFEGESEEQLDDLPLPAFNDVLEYLGVRFLEGVESRSKRKCLNEGKRMAEEEGDFPAFLHPASFKSALQLGTRRSNRSGRG